MSDVSEPLVPGPVVVPVAANDGERRKRPRRAAPADTEAKLAGPDVLEGEGRPQPGQRCLALTLCEIYNFPMLRRHLGRARADALAAELSLRILERCTDARIVTAARDVIEFAFEAASPSAATARIERLRAAFAEPFDIDGEFFQLQLIFGLATAPSGGLDEIRLAEAAESALEQSRAEKRVVLLDLAKTDIAFDRLALMRELPRAIADGELFLQYQPKVHVRRQEIASAEALVRWQHPERGLILPGDFISVAEEAGEIAALTLWTLRQVIADQRRLAKAGHDLPLFLNISGTLLADEQFVAEACDIVATGGAQLGFEITETAVIRDPGSAIRNLKRFAEIGVRLAIDDYGAGLSSLAYLKQLPAAELKIDKMFVLQLTSSNRDPLIVRSTIDLAHALEMEVTAEGVETPSALALLGVMGCDMVQGFLISRPLGFEALQRFIEDNDRDGMGPLQSTFVRPDSFWKRA